MMKLEKEKLKLIKVHDIKTAPFANLQQLYEFEFAPITKEKTNIDGLYDQEKIKKNWSQLGYDAYLIYLENMPIGFAVINLSSMINEDRTTRDVAEFFVMPAYRKSGVGKWAAINLFNTYKTKWEVRQLPGLEYAKAFWDSVIREYTFNNFESLTVDDSSWKGYIQKFSSI